MSEAYPAIKPWEWLTICEFWTDKIDMYLRAKAEVAPAIQQRREREAEAKASRHR